MRYAPLAVLIAAFAFIACEEEPLPEPEGFPENPNVLVILFDDLGRDWVDSYGLVPAPAKTPTLDELAAGGIRFDAAIAPPICSPTRYSLMTGRFGHRRGFGTAIGTAKLACVSAAEDETLADMFGAAGYVTAAFGKAHLCGTEEAVPDYMRTLVGFDHYFGGMNIENPKETRGYWNARITEDGITEPEPVPGRHLSAAVRDHAVAWLEAQESPWFVYYAPALPHSPYECPPAEELSSPCVEGDPYDIMPHMVEAADRFAGELIAAAGDDVIVIAIGDNGTADSVVMGPIEPGKAKGTIYDGGARVPFFAAGPGIVAGKAAASYVHVVDVFPTLAEILGHEITGEIDGESVTAILEEPAELVERFAFTEKYTPNGPSLEANTWDIAAWSGKHKLSLDENGKQEFYDLEADPFEESNLLSSELTPEQAASRAEILDFARPLRSEWFPPR